MHFVVLLFLLPSRTRHDGYDTDIHNVRNCGQSARAKETSRRGGPCVAEWPGARQRYLQRVVLYEERGERGNAFGTYSFRSKFLVSHTKHVYVVTKIRLCTLFVYNGLDRVQLFWCQAFDFTLRTFLSEYSVPEKFDATLHLPVDRQFRIGSPILCEKMNWARTGIRPEILN